jgi:putative thioredoxin
MRQKSKKICARPGPRGGRAPERAIARLQQEIAAAPDKPELKLDLALAFMRAGLADAAQTELDALPPNLAEDAKAKRLRHQIDFARALKDAPDLPTLYARVEQNPADHASRDLLGVRLLIEGEAAAGSRNSSTSCARSATGTTVRPRSA